VVPFGELGLIMMLMHSCFSISIDKNFTTHKNMQHITYILEAFCFLLTYRFASEMLCIVSSTFMTMEKRSCKCWCYYSFTNIVKSMYVTIPLTSCWKPTWDPSLYISWKLLTLWLAWCDIQSYGGSVAAYTSMM